MKGKQKSTGREEVSDDELQTSDESSLDKEEDEEESPALTRKRQTIEGSQEMLLAMDETIAELAKSRRGETRTAGC